MSAPASEDLREVERELLNATEAGETRSLNDLREQFPDLSREELLGMLAALREHGKAIEDAPGEWRGPTMDETRADAAVPVRVHVADEGDGNGGDPVAAAAALAARARAGHARSVAPAVAQPTVRLTFAIAEALDAEALGKLVKAGIDNVADGEVFVFEVTP